jgi:hypothetical protein
MPGGGLNRLLSIDNHPQVDNGQHNQNGNRGCDGCFKHFHPSFIFQKSHKPPAKNEVLPDSPGPAEL